MTTRDDRAAAARVFFNAPGDVWPSDRIAHWVARGDDDLDEFRQLADVAEAIAKAREDGRKDGYVLGVADATSSMRSFAMNDGTISGKRALEDAAESIDESLLGVTRSESPTFTEGEAYDRDKESKAAIDAFFEVTADRAAASRRFLESQVMTATGDLLDFLARSASYRMTRYDGETDDAFRARVLARWHA